MRKTANLPKETKEAIDRLKAMPTIQEEYKKYLLMYSLIRSNQHAFADHVLPTVGGYEYAIALAAYDGGEGGMPRSLLDFKRKWEEMFAED